MQYAILLSGETNYLLPLDGQKTREPYILFVQGIGLNHPLLEKGSRSKMKILRVNPNKDIARGAIDEILSKALSIT